MKIMLAVKSQSSKVHTMKETRTKSVRIPADMHRLLKVMAANSGKTISEVINDLRRCAKMPGIVPARKGK